MRAKAMFRIWMPLVVFAISAILVAGPAANAAEDLKVAVLLRQGADGNPIRTYQMGDPLEMKIPIQNLTGGGVIISSKFLARKYGLDLHFTRFLPDGSKEVITTSDPEYTGEPMKPKMRFRDVDGLIVNTPVEQVDILADEWVSGEDWFDVRDYYPLVPGRYEVQAVIPREIYEGEVLESDDGFSYMVIGTSAIDGDLVSVPEAFHLIDDGDGDGYTYPQAYGIPAAMADCDDSNAAVFPGAVEIQGDGIDNDCDPNTSDVALVDPGYIEILAQTHTVGPGSLPGVSKGAITDMPLRVYDKSDGSCVQTYYSASWHHYASIWGSCNPAVAEGTTDENGSASIAVPPGTYVAIGLTGGQYIGRSIDVLSGETARKYMQIIAKANGKKSPGKYKRKTGSELLIIEPEYVEWSGTEEYYPFIFESVGDWDVTTSVSPPEGFVADHDSLSEEVNNEVEAVQFVITDIGSEWVATGVTHEIKHKGKKEKIKSKVGVKLTKKLAKKKGLNIYGKKLKPGKEKKKE